MWIFGIIVVIILLVIGDFVAKAVAENQIANQIKQADSQVNPSVNIPGFPFLTQVVARNIHEIDISASNVPAGPVTISSVHAVAKGVHVNGSFNGGKVDTITATAFIGYASLSSALTSESNGVANLTLSSAGNGELKATFGVLGANLLTETGKITLKGNQVSLAFTGADNSGVGGLINGLTGGGSGGSGLANLDFTIPKLPAGVQITGFTVGTQGITMMGDAHNTTLSQ